MIKPRKRRWERYRALVMASLGILASAACGGGDVADGPESPPSSSSPDPILVAEDGRYTSEGALGPLFNALDDDRARRRSAVRALGRLENPAWIPRIAPLLEDPDPHVRREAVNAVAQAVARGDGGVALDLLEAHASAESHPIVLGTVGRAVGRLGFQTVDPSRAALLLTGLAAELPVGSVTDTATTDLALGFEALLRRNRDVALPEPALDWLTRASARGRSSSDADPIRVVAAARIRRTAAAALAAAEFEDPEHWVRSLADPDGQVRRVALGAASGTRDERLGNALRQALSDPDPAVRIQALTSYDVTFRVSRGCEPILLASREGVTRVALVAIDLLARDCPEASRQRMTLEEIARTTITDLDWHRAAHALVSLSTIDPDRGGRLLSRFVTSRNAFVRGYGARAAARVGAEDVLRGLAADSVDNVRESAVRGLFELRGHDIDSILVAQLDRQDPQLILTAARLLEGSPNGADWMPALLSGLDRVTRLQRETSRDSRRALIERIAEFGDSTSIARVQPYVRDFDPVIATLAGRILTDWSDTTVTPSPSDPPRVPLPTAQDLSRLARTLVVLEMQRGGEIVIRLFPRLAPTNAGRFARLAEAGYFDGLTFHRMASNFVIQGGSPGANEYSGDGPFTRDELGLVSHWRGTVGLSTRGRDTGDGQLFVNLVDNVRLNHEFTVFGQVQSGMDVVDQVLEGDVIVRARVTSVDGTGDPGSAETRARMGT
jgi:cyclophilin family peptidyl-prolyl cis-trans isomerase